MECAHFLLFEANGQFDAKQYKRHVVVFNLLKKDCVRLVFLRGASIGDTSVCWWAITPTVGGWPCFRALTRCIQKSSLWSERSSSG
jgi:hypothetical protein